MGEPIASSEIDEPPLAETHSHNAWLTTTLRRCITIPFTYLALGLWLASAPIWIPLAALVDLLSPGRRSTLRCGVFLIHYLVCEAVGIAAAFLIWLANGFWRGRPDPLWNAKLQRLWARWLLRGAMRIFHFRFEAEGEEALSQGRILLLPRHASTSDTMLTSEFAATRHHLRMRYVMKRELLWDPCLDIVGNRLRNYFVDRQSSNTEREVRGIQALMSDLDSDEGIMIYPEGTRFTEAKRARILEKLRSRDPELAERAESLRHVLPPRLAGTLALLDNSGLDAVFCAHTGFEKASSFWELWNGALYGQVVRVCFWRVPFAEIPIDRAGRIHWLFENWNRIDDWIEARRAQG